MRTGTRGPEIRRRLKMAHRLFDAARQNGDPGEIVIAQERVNSLLRALQAADERARLLRLARDRARDARGAMNRALVLGNFERAKVQRGHLENEMETVARLEAQP